MKKLNLGCGKDIREGFINSDIRDLPGVDYILDIEKIPYPFNENTFDFVLALNILEHFPIEDTEKILRENEYYIQKN